MQPTFLAPSELRSDFDAFGHFYVTEDGLRFRSRLEIRRKGSHQTNPDAVFVMMNPGSSKPLDESDWHGAAPSATVKLVGAHPDTTQYQLMRVMQHRGWDLARVINLSDYHESKSCDFFRKAIQFASEGFHSHSIFDRSRSEELGAVLDRAKGGPLICAWGVSERLNRLIAMAAERLAAQPNCHGWQKPDQPWKYYHPLPPSGAKQRTWLAKLLGVELT